MGQKLARAEQFLPKTFAFPSRVYFVLRKGGKLAKISITRLKRASPLEKKSHRLFSRRNISVEEIREC